MKKQRIDKLLVELGFAESRTKAQALVMSGVVLVDEQRIEKPSQEFFGNENIRIKGDSTESKYVGRGGLKLEKALEEFHIQSNGYVCLDLGASTGGFTDCLLQNGARKVYAVDVGYGILDYKLRTDDRVVVMERTNARALEPLPEPCDLAVFDLSFIGLEKVIPAARRSLKPGGELVVLLKPQFRARREEVGKKGVVKDPLIHAAVIGRFVRWTADNGL